MLRALLRFASAGLILSSAQAAPLTAAEVTRLCSDADGPAHCGRRVETEQLKRLPGLASREGSTLKLTLVPSGSVGLTDVDTLSGGTTYALWDFISELDTAVLWTTKDDDAGFLLIQRSSGRQTPLPAEPILAPDRQRFVTADFCATGCENTVAVWRVSRDGFRRETEWKPSEAWSDAGVRWKDGDTLVLEYTRAGSGETRTLERKLGDPGWVRR